MGQLGVLETLVWSPEIDVHPPQETPTLTATMHRLLSLV